PGPGEAGRPARAGALEGSAPGGGRAPRGGRRAGGLDARALVDLDARAREPRARPRGAAAAAGAARSGLRPVAEVPAGAGRRDAARRAQALTFHRVLSTNGSI